MPKGKKFDAAEVHFAKELLKVRKDNTQLREALSTAYQDVNLRRAQLKKANCEIACLSTMLQCLIDMTGVTEEQIREKMRKDEQLRLTVAWITKNYSEEYPFLALLTKLYLPIKVEQPVTCVDPSNITECDMESIMMALNG